jgi:hypothetical protein
MEQVCTSSCFLYHCAIIFFFVSSSIAGSRDGALVPRYIVTINTRTSHVCIMLTELKVFDWESSEK